MRIPRAKSILQLFVLGVAIVCVPLIIGTIWSVVSVQYLAKRSETLVARGLEFGRESEKLRAEIEELERNARQYLVVREPNVLDLYLERHSRLMSTLDWLESLVHDATTRALIESIRAVSLSILQSLRTHARTAADTDLNEDFQMLDRYSEELKLLTTQAIGDQFETVRHLTDDTRRVSYWVVTASLLAMVVLLVLSTRLIARPIRLLDIYVRRLGRGSLDEPIAIAGPGDVSELANRLDWLRMRMIEIDQAKDQFIREMSHQLKTPLASIREGTELLLDGSVAGRLETQREVVEILYQNSLDLQRMLENLLNFSAWRVDPKRLARENVKLKPLIQGVVERYRIFLMSKKIEFRLDCPDELLVHMDRAKMRVIVDNLISNAIKFSPVNSDITVRVQSRDDDIVLDVTDDGPGVTDSEREKVFELFYQGSGSSTDMRGTGVGLALVRAYVDAHGGSIEVINDNGRGGHFRVRLPRS